MHALLCFFFLFFYHRHYLESNIPLSVDGKYVPIHRMSWSTSNLKICRIVLLIGLDRKPHQTSSRNQSEGRSFCQLCESCGGECLLTFFKMTFMFPGDYVLCFVCPCVSMKYGFGERLFSLSVIVLNESQCNRTQCWKINIVTICNAVYWSKPSL